MGFKGSKVQILSSRPYIRKKEEGDSTSAVVPLFFVLTLADEKKAGECGCARRMWQYPQKILFLWQKLLFREECS